MHGYVSPYIFIYRHYSLIVVVHIQSNVPKQGVPLPIWPRLVSTRLLL